MQTPEESYDDLPVYILDKECRGYLIYRTGDGCVIRLEDGQWAATPVEQVATLH